MTQTVKLEGQRLSSLEGLCWNNVYSQLPPIFYARHQPNPLYNQRLTHLNDNVAEMIGLDPDEGHRPDFTDLISGASEWQGTDLLAMCYAGHQFGQYVPRLGDGRALLLGQLLTEDGQRWDLQLKGSGRTLYSRMGDGKAVLRSSIREYLCSAALDGLGIPTTHALALFDSDEEVYRESIETGAMIVRVAPSHIRIGSFEYFFYSNRFEDLAVLGNFVVEHYFPHLLQSRHPFRDLLDEVVGSTASLIAQWQSVGFCHGVMNSDNMSIHGITIDYGPFGFMDTYRAGHVCNHSDQWGRYAFDKQPGVGLFNLGCLAQAILPLLDDDPDKAVEIATDVLKTYESRFDEACLDLKRRKLGLLREEPDDGGLYDDLLVLMEKHAMDFTNTFRALCGIAPAFQGSDGERKGLDRWLLRYRERLERDDPNRNERVSRMKKVNPGYVLRNYMAEEAIRAARDRQDYGEIDRLIQLLGNPYEDRTGMEKYAEDAPEWAAGLAVSCSS